eukprot:scaffold2365_cov109-Skeletonema_marinoi.AAC.1
MRPFTQTLVAGREGTQTACFHPSTWLVPTPTCATACMLRNNRNNPPLSRAAAFQYILTYSFLSIFIPLTFDFLAREL